MEDNDIALKVRALLEEAAKLAIEDARQLAGRVPAAHEEGFVMAARAIYREVLDE